MLQQFSWLHFFLFFGVAALLWTLWVFKSAVRAKDRQPGSPANAPDATKRVWSATEVPIATATAGRYNPHRQDGQPTLVQQVEPETEGPGEFDQLEQLVFAIEKAIGENPDITTKEELLSILEPLVKQYPDLNEEGFRMTVHHLISSAAEAMYQLEILPADTDALWLNEAAASPDNEE